MSVVAARNSSNRSTATNATFKAGKAVASMQDKVCLLLNCLFVYKQFVYVVFTYLKGPHGVAREGGVGRGQRAGRVARELLVVHRKQGTDRRDSEFMRCFFTFWVFLPSARRSTCAKSQQVMIKV